MSDDTAKVRAELQILDGRIQAERNDEVRHGLQRGRLEAERAQLLVKLMETMAQPAVPLQPTTPYRVIVHASAREALQPTERPNAFTVVSLEKPLPATVVPLSSDHASARGVSHHKPAGVPTIPTMILEVLRSAEVPMKPAEIVSVIRGKWWPNMRSDRVYQSAFRLVRSGQLQRVGDRYRLASHNGAANVETAVYPAHA
jgi:hypothetical protein